MNNFEKMKRNISDQILGMNVTEFYEFCFFQDALLSACTPVLLDQC